MKAEPLVRFRDKVLAHITDKERFITHFSFIQYSKIKNEFKEILDAMSIVGTFSCNIPRNGPKTEIKRAKQWLINGLIESITPVHDL